ncbi:hypothetical protein F01_380075 [Burkholderia cenocepacia]|nr:hypothetical protein F01_380075 [Burkholderia cenocepacia]
MPDPAAGQRVMMHVSKKGGAKPHAVAADMAASPISANPDDCTAPTARQCSVMCIRVGAGDQPSRRTTAPGGSPLIR